VSFRADSLSRHTGIVCEIEPRAFRHWAGCEPLLADQPLEGLLDLETSTVRHLLRRLAEEARSAGVGSARLVEALFVQLAIELARHCRSMADAPAVGGLAGWRLRLIDERIADLANPPRLEELAELCGMSARQLTRAFRASRNATLGEYQLNLRLDAAKRRLAGPESIKEIAFALGFASPSRFAADFRRNVAITPLQFRQRVLHRANDIMAD
jgi:AraC family transcriptional regulator